MGWLFCYNKKMKEVVILVVLVGVLAVVWYFNRDAEPMMQNGSQFQIGEVEFDIKIADTKEGRVKGLSGREKIGENEGLLFIFEKEGYWGIWMKDMNFPIDIAWLDVQKKVLHIEHSVKPETYPKIFYPPVPAWYVLETAAGIFEKNKIKVRDVLETKVR